MRVREAFFLQKHKTKASQKLNQNKNQHNVLHHSRHVSRMKRNSQCYPSAFIFPRQHLRTHTHTAHTTLKLLPSLRVNCFIFLSRNKHTSFELDSSCLDSHPANEIDWQLKTIRQHTHIGYGMKAFCLEKFEAFGRVFTTKAFSLNLDKQSKLSKQLKPDRREFDV